MNAQSTKTPLSYITVTFTLLAFMLVMAFTTTQQANAAVSPWIHIPPGTGPLCACSGWSPYAVPYDVDMSNNRVKCQN